MPSVVFMGRKPGAVVAFEHLLAQGWKLPYVVTPAEEAEWLPRPTLRDVAQDAGVPVLEWKPFCRLVEQNQLKEKGAESVEWVFSYLFPYLIPPSILELPKNGALNFHPAPLPDYGGLGGYNFA
ncbi:MAG: hypothetical protein U9R79_00950, partial [Armatimonadota bacterium]|nr:hypothetical protein [Armatimonadota bacterium]